MRAFSENTGGNTPNFIHLGAGGIVSDADLSFGSSTFGTDQTAAIQAILNEAGPANPIVVWWDVKVSVTGLAVKSNTIILTLPGCGAILRDNANNFLLRNYNWTAGSNALQDFDIGIKGGIWNGNGYRGGVAKQIHSNADKGMIAGFCYIGVKNLKLSGLEIRNTRTFAFISLTQENLVIDDFIIDQGVNHQINQDGIDVIGYTKNARITNGRISCGDDRICFSSNATGGNNGGEYHEPYTGINGDMTSLHVDNIFGDGDGKFIRLISSTNKIENAYFNNLHGYCKTAWLEMESARNLTGYTMPQGDGDFRNITFENIDVEIPNAYNYDYTPDLHGLAEIGGNATNIIFRNIRRNNFAYNMPSIAVHDNYGTVVVKDLLIDNYNANEQGVTFANDHIQIHSGTVDNLRVINSLVKGNNSSNLVRVLSGAAVGKLSLNNVDGNGVTNIVSNQGVITRQVNVAVEHNNSTYLPS